MGIDRVLGVSGTANDQRAVRRRPFLHLTRLAAAGSALVAAAVSLGAGAGLAAAASAQPGGPASGSRMALMRAAASEFHVPVGLLLAISHGQTRWVGPGGSASVDGGYGLMDLTSRTFPGQDWRGTTVRPGARSDTAYQRPAEHPRRRGAAGALRPPADRRDAARLARRLVRGGGRIQRGPVRADGAVIRGRRVRHAGPWRRAYHRGPAGDGSARYPG